MPMYMPSMPNVANFPSTESLSDQLDMEEDYEDADYDLRRHFSTNDLHTLRKYENRKAIEEEHSYDLRHFESASQQNGDNTGALAHLQKLVEIKEHATTRERLPQFRRRESCDALETDNAPTVRRRNGARLNIITGTIPCFLNDSVTNLSGVRLPLLPQAAYDEEVNEHVDTVSQGPTPKHRRNLPSWQPILSPHEKKVNTRLYKDESFVMQRQPGAPGAAAEPRPSNPKSNGSSSGGLFGNVSLTQLVGEIIRGPNKRKAWYDRYNQNASMTGSQLTVLAWDNMVKDVPDGCKVVKVKRDEEDDLLRRKTRVRFNDKGIRIRETWSRFEYDRRPIQMQPFTLEDLTSLRNEMIIYKVQEMQVHPFSRKFTHVYRRFD